MVTYTERRENKLNTCITVITLIIITLMQNGANLGIFLKIIVLFWLHDVPTDYGKLCCSSFVVSL